MNTIKQDPAVILFCSDSSGIYIPQRFAEEIKRECLFNVSDEDLADLSDPNNEWYWDTWDRVTNNAIIKNSQGDDYILWQDGDLWLLCPDRMTDEERSNFGFED